MKYSKNILSLAVMSVLGISQSAYAFAEEQKESKADVERITITGTYSGSLSRAMDIKKESSNIVDVISAEDIGKFPSENVAEALQLVPGVQIDRNRGEGLGVSVRGLGPAFQITQLNGRNVAINENVENSGQNGRQFRYDILPSDLISGLEVVKSPSASMEEGAIGGLVNIKTFRPLQLNNSSSLTLRTSYSDLADSTDPKVSGLYNWKNDDKTFGILISGAYSERELRQDRVFTFGWLQGALEATPGNPSLETAFAPQRNRPTLERQSRERQSLSTAIQWESSDTHELNVDLLWSQFNVAFDEIGIDIELGGQVENAVLQGNSLVSGTALGTKLQLSRESSEAEHDSFTLGVNNKWTFDNWLIEADLSLSEANSITDDPIKRTRLRLNDQAVSFNYSNGHENAPNFAFPVDITDSSIFPGRRIEYRTIEANDEDYGLKLDFERLLDGTINSIQFGLSLRSRERVYTRRDIRVSDGISGEFFDSSFFDEFPVSDFASNASGDYPRTFTAPNGDAFHETFFTNDLVQQPLTTGDQRNSYVVEEDITAGYVQANFESLEGLPFFGNIGVRLVRSEQSPSGTSVIDGEAVAVDFTNTYTELLPSANINFELTDGLFLRAAFAKVIARPSLPDLRPGLTFSTDQPTAKGGNPLLNPYEALQYDLSLEWYFGESSYASGGLFYKDIGTFISTEAQLLNVNGNEVTLSAPFNTGEGDIQGIEVAFQHVFESLPEPFDGFGVQANYTYVESKVEATENGILTEQTIAGLSKNSFNFVAFYEQNNFGARLGYNWRDEFLVSNGVGVVADEIQAAFGTLDMSISYTLTDDINLSFEGVNLTDESIETFFEDEVRGGRIDHYGRRFSVGVNFKF